MNTTDAMRDRRHRIMTTLETNRCPCCADPLPQTPIRSGWWKKHASKECVAHPISGFILQPFQRDR